MKQSNSYETRARAIVSDQSYVLFVAAKDSIGVAQSLLQLPGVFVRMSRGHRFGDLFWIVALIQLAERHRAAFEAKLAELRWEHQLQLVPAEDVEHIEVRSKGQYLATWLTFDAHDLMRRFTGATAAAQASLVRFGASSASACDNGSPLFVVRAIVEAADRSRLVEQLELLCNEQGGEYSLSDEALPLEPLGSNETAKANDYFSN